MIKEDNISFTSDKIDDFVAQATKEVESAKNIFTIAFEKVKEISIGNIVENPSLAENYLDKIKVAGEGINKKHTKYFNIIEMYDVYEAPNNIKQLEKLTDKLDNYYYDLMKIENTLEDIISAASKLNDFYNKENI